MLYEIRVSAGELLDRWTILRVKSQELGNSGQSKLVAEELGSLSSAAEALVTNEEVADLADDLFRANLNMWNAMQEIYDWEAGPGEILSDLVLAVIEENKNRAVAKRRIDLLLESERMEAKSFFQDSGSDETL